MTDNVYTDKDILVGLLQGVLDENPEFVGSVRNVTVEFTDGKTVTMGQFLVETDDVDKNLPFWYHSNSWN